VAALQPDDAEIELLKPHAMLRTRILNAAAVPHILNGDWRVMSKPAEEAAPAGEEAAPAPAEAAPAAGEEAAAAGEEGAPTAEEDNCTAISYGLTIRSPNSS
jgi:hypothetical protein